MTVAIIDADSIIYASASIGEERYIEVKHLPTGRVREFKNKTEFYGHHKKKEGGWLGDLNKERLEKGLSLFPVDEFEIVEKQRVKEEIQNVLHTAKMMIASPCVDIDADSMVCFVGGNVPLRRWNLSTLLEYKGNRKDMLKPLLKDEVTEYILKHQNGVLVQDEHEADDHVIMEAVRETQNGERAVVVTIDKDVLGCPVLSYNPNKPELGVQNGDCFGRLYLDDKGEVRGIGRLFKYYQWINGDPVDNYAANAASEVKWGDKSAYNALKDVQTDKDAWKVAWDVFNLLYPEKKVITSWRGDEIEIDALYVAQEMWDMHHMLRWENDYINVSEVFKKYKFI